MRKKLPTKNNLFKKLSNTSILLSFTLFLLAFSNISYAQTPTDDCGTTSGAELTVGFSCSFTTWDSTTGGNYWSSGSPSCGEDTNRDDAWGWFTATSTSTTITYSPDTRNAILTLYDATCANNMVSLACANAGGDGVDETIVYATTIGNTYKVRIQRDNSNNNMTGDICVYNTPTPPANDLCSNAIALTVNTSCSLTTYTNANATDSGELPVPGCGSYNGADVWFTAVIPASGELNIDTGTGVITDGAMTVYTGTCGSLTEVACSDDVVGFMPAFVLTGTPGTTIYIRFWEYGGNNNGTFDICAWDPNPSTPCTSPTAQPTALSFGTITASSIDATFTAASPTADNYLVVMNTTNVAPSPVDTTSYNIGDTIGAGNIVVDNDSDLAFTASTLTDNTTYYFFIYSFNNTGCTGGPLYNTTSPLNGNATTLTIPPCSTPTAQATSLTFGTITSGTIDGSFTAASPTADNYLVVMNTTNVAPSPVDTTTYNIGDTIGAGNTVVDNDANTAFTAVSLSETTTYYFFIFAFNNTGCSGGPLYNTASPLNGNATTIATAYCIPSSSDTNNYIDDFSTTGGTTNITNNGSGYSANGYGDFTAMIVSQTAGGTVNFSSNFIGTGIPTFGANIWIDYNNDSDFTDLGEQVYASGAYVTNISGSFIIPAATPIGSYRMRILIDYSTTNPDSCTFVGSRGEAEDYTLVVGTPPACSTPTAQATGLTFGSITSSTIAGSFTAATPAPDNYLIVMNTTGVTPSPVDTTSYNIGDTIGAGNTVIDNDNNLVFSTSGLTITTTYYFFIFSYNYLGCTGGPLYNTASPLNGNATTTTIAAYCEPESTIDESVRYIDDVQFIGTLNDVSNLGSSYSSVATVGYQDWTGLTNSIQAQGEGINVFVEGNFRGHIKAWVDWDLDGLFNETNELVYDTGLIATTSTTFGYVIPANQAVGDYRLRIKLYNSFTSGGTESAIYDFDACENFDTNGVYFEYGETEDYTFTVIQSCDATIDSITEGFNCGDGTVSLTVAGSPGTIQYNWYANEGDVVPLATTASNTWITPNLTTTTAFYVTADNGSCESLVKTKVIATINPIVALSFTPSVPEVCGEDDIIEISASGANEVAYLIDEDFEGTGLGSFTNNNIRDHSAAESAITMWQQRTSTFIPSEAVWFPAISSGFGTNKFAMATSDSSTSNITENALESATLDSSNFTDLTLAFDIYFSRYVFTPTIPENVNVEVSTNGGTSWTTIQTYDNDIGYGTSMVNVSFNLDAYVDETDLKVRIRYFADYWCDGVAIDNIELYGSRPLVSSFTWTSPTTIDAYTDAATTIPYTAGTAVNTVYIRPTTTQLQQDTFSFIATATLSNGCDVSIDVDINNRTQYWTGATSTDWNDPTNWLPNGVPTSANCVIIPDQTIISGTGYDAYARNLTVRPTGDLELQSDNNLTVTEWVTVDTGGNFDIRDSASLVQIDNDANSGIVKMDRDTQPIYRYDYTYWSSPMTAASGYTLDDLSPLTLGDKFYSWLPTQAGANGTWVYANPNTTVMTPALGYIIRAPQTYSTDPNTLAVYSGQFEGTPNNGDISTPISVGTDANVGAFIGDTAVTPDDDQWNLIGNPYPSAIDVVSFLNEAGNSTLLDGTVYVWTHNTPPNASFPDPFYADFSINYTNNDYASINSLGATSTAATGGQTPTQYIAAGQAFFVQGLNNGSALFNNSMRVTNNNDNFFKNNGTNNNSTSDFEKHRLWLNLSNDSGSFSQILIGYAEGATNGWDRGLDANTFGGNGVTFYSVTPEKTLTIQAKPLPFEDSDVVPIGYKAITQGSHRIGIDHFDPLFDNHNIYIKDYDLDIVHDLKAAPYIFNSEAGTFNTRFKVFYSQELLSVNEYTIDENTIKVISNDKLTVLSQSKTITSIEVYDILGKRIMTHNNLNTNRVELEGIQKTNSALLLKIVFDNKTFLHKKALY